MTFEIGEHFSFLNYFLFIPMGFNEFQFNDILIIFHFRNFKIDLKKQFSQKSNKNSNARQLLNTKL